jgi:hypothetical protein
MYTLRIIEEVREDEKSPFTSSRLNIELGKSYRVLTPESGSDFFGHISHLPEHEQKNTLAVIIDNYGEVHRLINNTLNLRWNYFIMTDTGSTLERL